MEIEWATVLLLGLVLVIGSVTQSVAGFGIAVVAAPIVVMTVPELMPGALLVASLGLPLAELMRSWREVDRRILTWALVGRLLTTPVGVVLVAVLPSSAIALIVGVMVLIAVACSLWAFEIGARPATAFGAGLLTGVSGTAAGGL